MKKIAFLILLGAATMVPAFGQNRSEMRKEIAELKARLDSCQVVIGNLKSEKDNLISQIEEIKKFINGYPKHDGSTEETKIVANSSSSSTTTAATPAKAKQCAAITKAGTRCSRTAEAGSDYCWQHKKSNSSSSSTYNSGHVWHTGPRGGQYYINSNGKKVYRKR